MLLFSSPDTRCSAAVTFAGSHKYLINATQENTTHLQLHNVCLAKFPPHHYLAAVNSNVWQVHFILSCVQSQEVHNC